MNMLESAKALVTRPKADDVTAAQAALDEQRQRAGAVRTQSFFKAGTTLLSGAGAAFK